MRSESSRSPSYQQKRGDHRKRRQQLWPSTSNAMIPAAMILFLITGAAPPFLIVTLLVMCYLTGYELWKEQELPFLWKAWWVLLVFLLNVAGFVIFWAWLAYRRSRAASA